MSTGASVPSQQGSAIGMSNFPGGFASGVAIQNLPLINTFGGRIFWVDSVYGGDGNKGTFGRPFATIMGALTSMQSGGLTNNDILIAKDGHAETVTAAAGIAINQAGLTILGLGNARRRPTITFTTSTAASIALNAANVRWTGFRFVQNIANQVTCFDFNAVDCTVDGCEFFEGTAQGANFIALTNSAVNACDRLKINNNSFYGITNANYVAAINLTTVQDGVEIVGNFIRGFFSTAPITNPTATVLTNMVVWGNGCGQMATGKSGISITSACTGVTGWNTSRGPSVTSPGITRGSMVAVGNDSDNYGVQESGGAFSIGNTYTSSAITTAAQTAFTCNGGTVIIDNIIVRTDATGLAGGTNFQILTNNTSGASVILSETVANLGANKTVDLFSASVTKQRTEIEVGKLLQYNMTVANGTGAGTVRVTFLCRRASPGSYLA